MGSCAGQPERSAFSRRKPVNISGFVWAQADGPPPLARLTVRCCLADATPSGLPAAWPEGTTPQPDSWLPSRAAWRFSSIEVRQRPWWCPIRSGRLLVRSGRWNHDPTAASVVELRCWGRSAAAPTAKNRPFRLLKLSLSRSTAAAPRWICASAARWT